MDDLGKLYSNYNYNENMKKIYFNPVVPGIFNKPGLPGGANLPYLLFCFVFTAARSADVLFQTKLSIDLDSKDAGVRIIFLIRLG